MEPITAWAETLTAFWVWMIAAALLMIAELAAPGTYLIWLGLAALATGLVLALVSLGWQAQLVLFALLALASVLAGRRLARAQKASDQPFLNRRAAALVGRAFRLREPIEGGVGQVRVDDTIWRVIGEDCPAGSRVVVIGVEGATLRVRPEGSGETPTEGREA